MLSKVELGTLANTLISMGTDYLVGGLDEYTFRLNLKVYSEAAQQDTKEAGENSQQQTHEAIALEVNAYLNVHGKNIAVDFPKAYKLLEKIAQQHHA